MRINVLNQDSSNQTAMNESSMTFSGPVFLFADPTFPLEAATKNYVDSMLANHANLSSIHLAPNEKTLISGITVGYGDINQLSGIQSSVQTQIDDKLNIAGGAMLGYLSYTITPTVAYSAINKNYVDTGVSAYTTINTGDVVLKSDTSQIAGYLRCNGAYVAQATYPDLYAAIGHNFDGSGSNGIIDLAYILNSTLGSGQPWKQQYDISPNAGTINNISSSSLTLPTAVAAAQVVVTKNRVYLLGGHGNGGTPSYNTIQVALINTDGTLGAFAIDSNTLPNGISWAQIAVTKNRVYLLGGWNSSTYLNTIYTAPINPDGTLGAFVNTGATLPTTIGASQSITTKSRVYLLGGYTASVSVLSSIYSAPINADGTLGGFITDSITLPSALFISQTVVTKNRVYLLGGNNSSGSINRIYTAPINSDGTLGIFVVDSNVLPATIQYSQGITLGNKVYIFGGQNTTSGPCSNIVYVATINADGTLNPFVNSNITLPTTLGWEQVIATQNHVYLLGGYDGATNLAKNTVYVASITNVGINDYTKLYDGSVNLFDGTNIQPSTITIYNDNPDPTTLFAVPNFSYTDSLIPGSTSYIKY